MGITEIVNNKLFERVHPCLIKKNTYIANVNGVMNAVIIEGNPVGESVLQGEGAGPGPTSSSLLSDLLSIFFKILTVFLSEKSSTIIASHFL